VIDSDSSKLDVGSHQEQSEASKTQELLSRMLRDEIIDLYNLPKPNAGTRLTGVLQQVRLKTPAVVIAEDWPMWLTSLLAMGFRDISVWSRRPDLVLTTYFTDVRLTIFENLSNLQNISKFCRPMLSVSGPCPFVKRVVEKFREFKTWVTVPAHGAGGQWKRISRMKDFAWQQLRHSQVGGVTDGSCWVGSNTGDRIQGNRILTSGVSRIS
jgi:hypothetical protein